MDRRTIAHNEHPSDIELASTQENTPLQQVMPPSLQNDEQPAQDELATTCDLVE